MSPLPRERIDIGSKPFTNTGVDYFGPITVKLNRKTRLNQATSKRYGVIFTCLTIRAAHIELAGDLSTDSFILALKRLNARRGNVQIIRWDNGTNFVGAEKELRTAINSLHHSNIIEISNNLDIK